MDVVDRSELRGRARAALSWTLDALVWIWEWVVTVAGIVAYLICGALIAVELIWLFLALLDFAERHPI